MKRESQKNRSEDRPLRQLEKEPEPVVKMRQYFSPEKERARAPRGSW